MATITLSPELEFLEPENCTTPVSNQNLDWLKYDLLSEYNQQDLKEPVKARASSAQDKGVAARRKASEEEAREKTQDEIDEDSEWHDDLPEELEEEDDMDTPTKPTQEEVAQWDKFESKAPLQDRQTCIDALTTFESALTHALGLALAAEYATYGEDEDLRHLVGKGLEQANMTNPFTKNIVLLMAASDRDLIRAALMAGTLLRGASYLSLSLLQLLAFTNFEERIKFYVSRLDRPVKPYLVHIRHPSHIPGGKNYRRPFTPAQAGLSPVLPGDRSHLLYQLSGLRSNSMGWRNRFVDGLCAEWGDYVGKTVGDLGAEGRLSQHEKSGRSPIAQTCTQFFQGSTGPDQRDPISAFQRSITQEELLLKRGWKIPSASPPPLPATPQYSMFRIASLEDLKYQPALVQSFEGNMIGACELNDGGTYVTLRETYPSTMERRREVVQSLNHAHGIETMTKHVAYERFVNTWNMVEALLSPEGFCTRINIENAGEGRHRLFVTLPSVGGSPGVQLPLNQNVCIIPVAKNKQGMIDYAPTQPPLYVSLRLSPHPPSTNPVLPSSLLNPSSSGSTNTDILMDGPESTGDMMDVDKADQDSSPTPLTAFTIDLEELGTQMIGRRGELVYVGPTEPKGLGTASVLNLARWLSSLRAFYTNGNNVQDRKRFEKHIVSSLTMSKEDRALFWRKDRVKKEEKYQLRKAKKCEKKDQEEKEKNREEKEEKKRKKEEKKRKSEVVE